VNENRKRRVDGRRSDGNPMYSKEAVLSRLTRSMVESVHPLRIILFGSAARGAMGPDSDFDLLVVMPDGSHRRRTAQKLYRDLAGIGFSKDIWVVTQKDIRDFGDEPSLVIKPALDESKELYLAATPTT
jgi:predicted nucleotidyltransferase